MAPEVPRVLIEHVGDEEVSDVDRDDATAHEVPPIGPDYDACSDDDGMRNGGAETTTTT
jgi:hypothetical protein